jgi:hypothetical protein
MSLGDQAIEDIHADASRASGTGPCVKIPWRAGRSRAHHFGPDGAKV